MKRLDIFYIPVCTKHLMPFEQQGRIRHFCTRDIRYLLVLLGPQTLFCSYLKKIHICVKWSFPSCCLIWWFFFLNDVKHEWISAHFSLLIFSSFACHKIFEVMVLACLSFPRYSMENSCAFILVACCISWYTYMLTVHDIIKCQCNVRV